MIIHNPHLVKMLNQAVFLTDQFEERQRKQPLKLR